MADLTQHSIFNNTDFEVLTDQGFKDFRGVIKGQNDTKIRIGLSTGQVLICTPKHKLITNENMAHVYASKLVVGDLLYGDVRVVSIDRIRNSDPVFEFLEVSDNHRYICNGILNQQCLILDELAFVPAQVIEEFWESVMPVISSSSKSQIFVVSTPNGTQNRFYELYKTAEIGEGTWHAERVDWYEVPGRTERWKKTMIEDLGSVERFEQEFGNQFVEVGQSPFAKQVFDDLRDMKDRPKYAFTDTLVGFEPQAEPDEYTTYRVWKPAVAGHTYSIGVDVSEGVGRAASVAAVLDITDLTNIELVAMYHNRRVQPVQFATKLLKIAQQYGNPNMLVERNNCGGQVIDTLSNIHHYSRLVNYSPNNPNMKYYDRLGIYSHSNAKYKGVTNMRYWFDHLRAMRIYDIATVQEFETFIRQPNGTWSHQDGEHIYDDRVMAIVWALFILEKEIAEKYLYVIEYDNTGRPSRVEDPYSETYDIDPMQMAARNTMFAGGNSAPVSMIGRQGVSAFARDDDMQDLLAQGWKVANQQFDGSTAVMIL